MKSYGSLLRKIALSFLVLYAYLVAMWIAIYIGVNITHHGLDLNSMPWPVAFVTGVYTFFRSIIGLADVLLTLVLLALSEILVRLEPHTRI
jgi:hypothetical protein